MREVANEAAVEVGKAKEGTNFVRVGGGGPVVDYLELGGVHVDGTVGDDMAEEVDSRLAEGAFLGVEVEGMLMEQLEYLSEMSGVGGEVEAVDEDIVEIDDNRSIKERAKDIVHEGRKGSRCVGEAERHDGELVGTVAGYAGGLRHVSLLDPHLEVPALQVELGEDPGATKTVKEIIDTGNGTIIANGDAVQAAIIDA